jgi:ribosome-binding ATPase YchF (GTP1/OBG family)
MWKGNLTPEDIETIILELIFADLEMLERRIDRSVNAQKGPNPCKKRIRLFSTRKRRARERDPARNLDWHAEDKAMLDSDAC